MFMLMATAPTDHRTPLDLLSPFDRAARAAGLTHDQLARKMGITPPQLCQQLRLQGHLSLRRLLKLREDAEGRLFLAHYWPLVAEDMGLQGFADGLRLATALAAFIDRVQIKMVRADLEKRERAQEEVA